MLKLGSCTSFAMMPQHKAPESKCCAADRALFPGDINAFIKNNNSRGLSDWILGNKGWIAASIKRREKGDLGSIPIIDWVATEETNDADKINRVKENRRRQVLVEEERKERKKAKQRQKRQNKKSKTNQNKNEPTVKSHFKTVKKKQRKLKHVTKKRLENEPRQKKRKRNETKDKTQPKLFPYIMQRLKNVKEKIVSSVKSRFG